MPFKDVPTRYDGPALERETLEFWKREGVFAKTLAQSIGRPAFAFNEGPPTANGRPGLHHVLARTFKDLFPRYKTMRGYHVPRKAGWDTHGLPVEHEIEKELGIFDKKRIEQEVGIAEFNRRCRESVLRYIQVWERMTERMGYWVDLEHAYYTLDNKFIESVWYLLRVIWDKGLIQQDYKVVPYDPRIGATLSSHEVALGYREVEDPSVYVRFPVAGEAQTYFLVWTTTPWTLPSNCALAVNPDIAYQRVRLGQETLILAKERVRAVVGAEIERRMKARQDAGQDTVGEELYYEDGGEVPGRALVGMRYTRLFDFLKTDADICRVLPGGFVTTEDGTGIVHIAPAYGADDLELGKAHGLPVLHGVGLDGCFLPEVTPVAGKFFKDADPILTRELKGRGLLFHAGRHLHNYPFGWRTGDPLIYYAKNAWYIRTTAVKERLVALNDTINWVPATIKQGRFGNWLENNVDWALSRERFWGTPLPVWTDWQARVEESAAKGEPLPSPASASDSYICIGSVAELEALTGRDLKALDLHRPAIDEIAWVHPKTGRTWRRVPEVIDCWFDSGAMSYAQFHYPFENQEQWRAHFPADYICEAIDQTRGWFYTLHAIATLVSDSVAYRNVICLSHLVDKDGKKMSKSQGNIVDPADVFDTVGADPLRWHFTARVAPDAQKRVSVDIVGDVAGTFLNTWWNTYSFFVTYAKLDRVDLARGVPPAQRPEADRWILGLLHDTVARATAALDAYDAQTAGAAIERFVDQLSNWYVRRTRRRFWKAEAGADKQAAYLTLYECLTTANRLMAPFMPFVTEAVHANLVRGANPDAPLSVHMDTWPAADAALIDRALLEQVAAVQRIVALGRAARSQAKLKVRQPLGRLLVRVPDEAARRAAETHQEQILEELNVKALEFIAPDATLVSYRLKPNLPRIGRRHGKLIPAIRAALQEADGRAIAAACAKGESFTLRVGAETLAFEPDDVLVETHSAAGYASAEDAGYLAALDTRLTPELLREGLAREITRAVQDARKQAHLRIEERIVLSVSGGPAVQAAFAAHQSAIAEETLAARVVAALPQPLYTHEGTLDGEPVEIRIAKA
jgi:isoleucyl-tRNA synthetase